VIYGLITVVDDDESMGRMLNRGLRAAGFDVAVFASAEELLNSGHLNKSACLIVDVHLPGMTGLQLQQRLKESGSSLPIILISGQPDERTATRALQDGAIGFFKKPFDIERLLATISDHLATLPSNGG
jgi:FixJ family two-component response regulator